MTDETYPEPPPVDVGDADIDEARKYSMVIAWSPEDDAYVVSVPELPGLHTHGETPSEAEEMGEEVIALWLAAHQDLGRPVAPPSPARSRVVIEPAEPVDADRIRQLRDRLRLSQTEFASALNVSPSSVEAWEQRQGTPDGASARMLEIAERDPARFLSLIQRPNRERLRSA